MTSIKHYDLSWWVEKIKSDAYFSVAGFGDGEFLCIQGRKGGNSHGCAYTPELQADLIKTLKENPDHFYKGLNRILPSQFKLIRPLLSGNWIDREILADELIKGGLKPFFDAIKEKDIVIVSSNEKRTAPFNYVRFIETPRTNTHNKKQEIIEQILATGPNINKPTIFLYACGMAAGTIIQEVHGKLPRSFHLDIGHILDPFCAENMALSRDYLQGVSRETLDKNL